MGLLLNNQKELYCIGKIYELFECILEFSSTKTQVKMDQALGLNRSYLTRLFKEATGLSPREYKSTSQTASSFQQQETT